MECRFFHTCGLAPGSAREYCKENRQVFDDRMSDEDIDLIFFNVDHSATMDDEQLSLVHEAAPRFWKQRDRIQLGH